MEMHLEVPATDDGVSLAHHCTKVFLQTVAWFQEPKGQDFLLVTMEGVKNAIFHGSPPTGGSPPMVRLTFMATDTELTGSVSDTGAGFALDVVLERERNNLPLPGEDPLDYHTRLLETAGDYLSTGVFLIRSLASSCSWTHNDRGCTLAYTLMR